MKGKYLAAAGVAVVGVAAYFFLRKRRQPATQPLKENERHHLTSAFSRAKQVAVGR